MQTVKFAALKAGDYFMTGDVCKPNIFMKINPVTVVEPDYGISKPEGENRPHKEVKLDVINIDTGSLSSSFVTFQDVVPLPKPKVEVRFVSQ